MIPETVNRYNKPRRTDTKLITQLIIIINPSSTQVERAKQKFSALQKHFPNIPVTIIETSYKGRLDTHRLLSKNKALFGPNTLICIASGDGTINLVIDYLLLGKELSKHARQTVILPLWGGNANDLAWMLNGSVSRVSMLSLATKSHIIPIRALQFDLKSPSLHEIRLAATTASIGASALVAQKLNKESHRQKKLNLIPGGRLLLESTMAWKTFLTAPLFEVFEDNKQKSMFEYTFANGSRMAKHYRMPVRLTDDWFYLSESEGKMPVITPTLLTASFVRLVRPNALRKYVKMTVKDRVMAQFDGEEYELQPNTEITVSLTELPFYAISTVVEKN